MKNFQYSTAFTAAIALGCALQGCASVAEGSTQPIMVSTVPVSGATCTLSNTRGKWTIVTPGTVTVQKSASVIKVDCAKDGWQDGIGYLTPRVPAMAQVGMIMPYVGILSAAVDGSTGAANEYPSSIQVSMKEVPPATPAASVATSSPASPQK